MPLEVLSPVHREALIDFLTEAFHLPKTAPFVDPKLVDWKYDEPRPDWPGSRSYTWVDGGRIAAHACICPVTYRAADSEIKASYLIDWAASRSNPGAGVQLLRKLAGSFQVMLAIGGSKETRQILPKLGYRWVGEMAIFVRVVHPWRQFRTDPSARGWKAPLRLARNLFWSHAAVAPIPPDWTCEPVAEFNFSHASLLGTETPFPSTKRTPELMNYWLRCPSAAMRAFLLKAHDRPCGWFVLSRIAGVVRIADLRIQSSDAEHWRAAYAQATQTALADERGCELIAAASTALDEDALRRSGFRRRDTLPVFLLDPHRLLIEHAPLDIALIESDAAYLYDPDHPYLT